MTTTRAQRQAEDRRNDLVILTAHFLIRATGAPIEQDLVEAALLQLETPDIETILDSIGHAHPGGDCVGLTFRGGSFSLISLGQSLFTAVTLTSYLPLKFKVGRVRAFTTERNHATIMKAADALLGDVSRETN
jgi:hypothetical protein